MDPRPDSRLTLKECAEMAADVYGREAIVQWAENLLAGLVLSDDPTHPDIAWFKGDPSWPAYWGRVWGARALLHLGTDHPATVLAALGDAHWRVREMALKVIAAHHLPDADGMVDPIVDDPVERVRVQAWRALGRREPS